MPVKWDSAKNEALFVKLYRDVRVTDTDIEAKVVNDWPDSLGLAPTVRAVKEHLLKLRTQTPPTNTNTKTSASISTPPSSGKKRRAGPSCGAKAKKVKREDTSPEAEMATKVDDEDELPATPSYTRIKTESRASAGSVRASLPRESKAGTRKTVDQEETLTEDSDEVDDVAAAGGEFVPDEDEM